MNTNAVPPVIQPEKQILGLFSYWDGAKMGIGVGLVLAILVLPISFSLRIILGGVVALIAIVVVFGRVPKSGYTAEEMVYFWLMYITRSKRKMKGTLALSGSLDNSQMQVIDAPSKPRPTRVHKESDSFVPRFVERLNAFYAFASGEPNKDHHRRIWSREVAAFVYLADRYHFENYLDLKGHYPDNYYWAIVNIMTENGFLNWRDDNTLICKDPRRMRVMIRRGILTVPDTNSEFLNFSLFI